MKAMKKRIIGMILSISLLFSSLTGMVTTVEAEENIDTAYFTQCREPERIYNITEISGTTEKELNTYLPDNESAKAFFRGNICLIAGSNKIWINDSKYEAKKNTKFIDETLYIPGETLAAISSAPYSYDGVTAVIGSISISIGSNQLLGYTVKPAVDIEGTAYVPAEDYAIYVMGKSYSISNKGLAVIGSKDVSGTTNSNNAKKMLNYLAFDRPSTEKIKADVTAQAHPRVFASEAQIENALELSETNATVKSWSDSSMSTANTFVTAQADVRTENGVAHGWWDDTVYLPMYWAYRKTGQAKYAEKAIEVAYATAQLDTWGENSTFLNTSNITMGCSLVYDLFYDYMTEHNMEAQKNAIAGAIRTHALKIAQAEYKRKLYSDWPTRENNWNLVCNAGMIMGAVTVMETDTELCSEVIQRALVSMENAMPSYAPDGGWYEGISYWEYTTTMLIMGINALDIACGTNYGITNVPGFLDTGYFLINSTGSTYSFEYHDAAVNSVISSTPLIWLARKTNDMALQKYSIDKGSTSNRVKDILWYTDAVMPENGGAKLDASYPNAGEWTMRSNQSNKPVFVGMHAGANNVTHGQLDIGDFEYEANGVKFAGSMGKDDDSLSGIYNIGAERNNYYANRAEGQNVFVVNPSSDGGQVTTATSTVTRIKASDSESAYAVDMTPAYANQVQTATRGYKLTSGRQIFMLQDEITPKAAGDEYYWFWHTSASIQIDNDNKTAVLVKDGKTVTLKFECNVPLTLSAGGAKPMVDKGSPNPTGQLQKSYQINMKKITAVFKSNGTDKITLRVTAIPQGIQYTDEEITPINKWGGDLADDNIVDIETSYVVDNTAHTISGVKQYTSVEDFFANITDLKGKKAWIESAGKQVTSGYIKNGYLLRVGDEIKASSLKIILDDDIIGSRFDDISYTTNSWTIVANKIYAGGYANNTSNRVELMTTQEKGGGSIKLSTGGEKPTNGNTQVATATSLTSHPGYLNIEISAKLEDNNLKRAMVVKDSKGNFWKDPISFDTDSKIKIFNQAVMSYELNKWYNIVLALDMIDKKYDVYINGEKVMDGISSTNIRNDVNYMRFDVRNVKDVSSVTWVDDFRIYETGSVLAYEPEYEGSAITISSDFTVTGDYLKIINLGLYTYANLVSALGGDYSIWTAYDANGNVVTANATAEDGSKLMLVSSNGAIVRDFILKDSIGQTGYNVDIPNKTISGVKKFTSFKDFYAKLGQGSSNSEILSGGTVINDGYIKDGYIFKMFGKTEYTIRVDEEALNENFDNVTQVSYHLTDKIDGSTSDEYNSVLISEDKGKGGKSVKIKTGGIKTGVQYTYVSTNSNFTDIKGTKFNVEFSVKPEDKNLRRVLVAKNGDGTEWWLPEFASFEKDGRIRILYLDVATYEIGKWYDFVVAIDSELNTYAIYINGELIKTGTSDRIKTGFSRPRFETRNENNVSSVTWFDDFKIYETGSSLSYEPEHTNFIRYVTLTDLNGNIIDEPCENGFNIAATVDSGKIVQPAILIAVVYNGDVLEKVFKNDMVEVSGRKTLKLTVKTDSIKNKTIKLFVWNGFDKMQSLDNSRILTDSLGQ